MSVWNAPLHVLFIYTQYSSGVTQKRLRPASAGRHHPVVVVLHWLIALIVLSEAALGVGELHFLPNTATKVPFLTVHMILGIMFLLLVVAQIATRFAVGHPDPATTGSRFLDLVARVTHALLYVMALLMGTSGMLLALQSHVLALVSGGTVAFPMLFDPFVHAVIFILFGLLVGLHTVGALYHHFVLRDGLFARMWFSSRGLYQDRETSSSPRPEDSVSPSL